MIRGVPRGLRAVALLLALSVCALLFGAAPAQAAVPSGSYEGTVGKPPSESAISFTLTESGKLSGFTGTVFCYSSSLALTVGVASGPDIIVQTGKAFHAEWVANGGGSRWTIDGTVKADGSASGTVSGDLIVEETGKAYCHGPDYAWSAKRVAQAEPTFADVPSSHLFFTEIEWMAASGYASKNRTFKPDRATSRGEMASFLMRVSEPGYQPAAGAKSPFADVPKDHLHYQGIEWLAAKGFASKNRTFKPDKPISRAEMASFLQRIYAGDYQPKPSLRLPFEDVARDSVHYRGIAWMFEQGHASPNRTFKPSNPTKRGEMAAFIYRIRA